MPWSSPPCKLWMIENAVMTKRITGEMIVERGTNSWRTRQRDHCQRKVGVILKYGMIAPNNFQFVKAAQKKISTLYEWRNWIQLWNCEETCRSRIVVHQNEKTFLVSVRSTHVRELWFGSPNRYCPLQSAAQHLQQYRLHHLHHCPLQLVP